MQTPWAKNRDVWKLHEFALTFKAPNLSQIAACLVSALYSAPSLRLKDAMSFRALRPIQRIIGPVRA
jgi:hypothetical protein